MVTAAPCYHNLSNWAPAFAGEVFRGKVAFLASTRFSICSPQA
jgi:hypothetical protein